MISYNLAPVPLWVFRDNLGEPLANGYMKAYRDTVRSEYKAVYSNAAGTSAYVQPITFNAAGFQGPFYWASDENYFLQIYDSNNNLIRSIEAYNAPDSGGSGPITNNIDFSNYIIDPQFMYPVRTGIDPISTLEYIGVSNWQFQKSNTTATDKILIQPFPAGSSTPPNNPESAFLYECSVAGSGETYKFLEYLFKDVSSFQNREMTIAFWGLSDTVADSVQISFWQEFGTGGTPSAPVVTPVTTFNLTASWAQYSISGTPPTIAGKTIGTNGDDYLKVLFQLPLNAVTNILMTNMQINDGNQLLDFNYLPKTNAQPLQYKVNQPEFKCISASTTLGASPTLVSMIAVDDPFGWVIGGEFVPTYSCRAGGLLYCNLLSLTGGVDVQLSLSYNGSVISSFIVELVANVPKSVTLPISTSFNGTTDSIALIGICSTAGAASAQLINGNIQIL